MINALELYRQIRDEWDKTNQPLQERASILPLGRYNDGSVGLAVPGIINQGLEGIQNFGRYGYDSPEAIRDNAGHAFDAAGLAMTGGLGAGIAGLSDNALSGVRKPDVSGLSDVLFGSRNARIYDPPNRPQRAFDKDYPDVTGRHDAEGRLTHDVEGRPLNPDARVVGRNVVGGEDVPLSPSEFDAITEALIGSGPQSWPQGTLGRGKVGTYRIDPTDDGLVRNIGVLDTLKPDQAVRVTAHEMGHMLDDLSGDLTGYVKGVPVHAIPQKGLLQKELQPVYNDLNNADLFNRRASGLADPDPGYRKYWNYTPDASGYEGADVPPEYMAEAIRAYMADPNYLKTVAPKTAKRIREYVNSNPLLNKTIQFNANAPTGAAIPLGMSGSEDTDIEPALMQYLRAIGLD